VLIVQVQKKVNGMKFKLLGLKTVTFGVALVAGIVLGMSGIHYMTTYADSNYVFSEKPVWSDVWVKANAL